VAVEFRLLGDLDVRIDGRTVEVGNVQQRCVLVALLLEANRVVPVDQLVDRVWGDRAPQRARGTLYSYLSRLRRVLATTDDAVIVRQPCGYVLTADPHAVDVHRFQHLVGQARGPTTSARSNCSRRRSRCGAVPPSPRWTRRGSTRPATGWT